MLFALFCFSFPAAAAAEVILEDDFIDTSLVDISKTSAMVDVAGGYVRLPKNPMPNAIAMLRYGEGYAVTTSEGVIISEYDAATGALHDTQINWLTNARGLAVRQDNLNLWVIGEDYAQYCEFSGGAYSDDPALKASGLTNVLSVSSVEGTDQAVVLSRTADGKAKITRYRAGSALTVELEKDLDIDEPVALSVVDGGPDVVVVTKTEKYYLMFDDATGDYIEDPARKASGYSNIVSAGANQDGTALLDGAEGRYLQYDDAGGVQQDLAYSAGSVPGAVALSIKPGAYEQAFITETGEVRYYAYNDATDSMARVPELEKTGLQLSAVGYSSPKEYYSMAVTSGRAYDEVRLTVDEDLPAGTSVKYFVSSDGGISWTEVLNGQWTEVPEGTQFKVKAVLDTQNKDVTPKILKVTLEVTILEIHDLEIRAIAYNMPGQPVPINTFPAVVKAGAEVQFEVDTKGCAESVTAVFTTGHNVVLTPMDPVEVDENTWRGLYAVPPDAEEGSTIGVTITAERGTKQKHLTQDPFIRVVGSVLFEVELSLVQ